MTTAKDEGLIREMLASIAENQKRTVRTPHGFRVESAEAVEIQNAFAPSLTHSRVTVALVLPVVYSYTTSRAHLPTNTSELMELREDIENAALEAPERVTLLDWTVTPDPDDVPDPYGPEGLAEPHPDWTVTAVFDVG